MGEGLNVHDLGIGRPGLDPGLEPVIPAATGGVHGAQGLRLPTVARAEGARELPEPPTIAELKQDVSAGAKAVYGLKVAGGILAGIVGGVVGLAAGIVAAPFYGLYKAGKAIYSKLANTNLPAQLEVMVPPGGEPIKWNTAGMPKVAKGTDPETVRLQLQEKVNTGAELIDRLSRGEDIGRAATKEDVSNIMFFLHARGEQKMRTGFDSGSMTIPDPGGRIRQFLDSSVEAYQRPSSHLEALQDIEGGTHRGVDLDPHDPGLVSFPKGKGTLLYGRIPAHQATGFDEERLFLKLEEHGSWMGPVVQRDAEGPRRSMNRHDPGAFLGHSLGFLGSLKRRLSGNNNAAGTFKERIPPAIKNGFKTLVEQAPDEATRKILSHNDPTGTSGGVRIMKGNIERLRAQYPSLATDHPDLARSVNDFYAQNLSGGGTLDHPELRFGQEIVFTSDELLSTSSRPSTLFLNGVKEKAIDTLRKELQADDYTKDLSDQFLKDLNRADFSFNGVHTKDPQDVIEFFDGDAQAARIVTSLAHQGLDGAVFSELTNTDHGPFKGAPIGGSAIGEYAITKESDDVYKIRRQWNTQPKMLTRIDGDPVALNAERSLFGYSIELTVDLSSVPRDLGKAIGDDFFEINLNDDEPLSAPPPPTPAVDFGPVIRLEPASQQILHRFIPEASDAEKLQFAREVGEDVTKLGPEPNSLETTLRAALGDRLDLDDLSRHLATLGTAIRSEIMNRVGDMTSTAALKLRNEIVDDYVEALAKEVAVVDSNKDIKDPLKSTLRARVLNGERMPREGAAAAMLTHASKAQEILRESIPEALGSDDEPAVKKEKLLGFLRDLFNADNTYLEALADLGEKVEEASFTADNYDAVLRSNSDLPAQLLDSFTNPVAEDVIAPYSLMIGNMDHQSPEFATFGSLMTGLNLVSQAATMVDGGAQRLESWHDRLDAKGERLKADAIITTSTLSVGAKQILRAELDSGEMAIDTRAVQARVDHLGTVEKQLLFMRDTFASDSIAPQIKGVEVLRSMAIIQKQSEKYLATLAKIGVEDPQTWKGMNFEIAIRADLGAARRLFDGLIAGDRAAPLAQMLEREKAVDNRIADLEPEDLQKPDGLRLLGQKTMMQDLIEIAELTADHLDGRVDKSDGAMNALQEFYKRVQ